MAEFIRADEVIRAATKLTGELAACQELNADLLAALEGMIAEWDKLTRYGSPLAKAANENVNAARAAIAKAREVTP